MVERIKSCSKEVKIALVGKYVQLQDSYLSIVEALHHGGWINRVNVKIDWIDSEELNKDNLTERLGDADGIIIPGGFGDRGIEGMILAAGYARENNIPYLGICLGMQIAAISYARDVLGLSDANSGEFAPDGVHKVIDLMPDQQGNLPKGGTMRLGAYPCNILPGSVLEQCYGEARIAERHRHRYEFNNAYRDLFAEHGMVFSGTSPDNRLVEAVELPNHPFYIGVQFHPEFKSRPNRPHPLFRSFIHAICEKA